MSKSILIYYSNIYLIMEFMNIIIDLRHSLLNQYNHYINN